MVYVDYRPKKKKKKGLAHTSPVDLLHIHRSRRPDVPEDASSFLCYYVEQSLQPNCGGWVE